MAFNKDTPPLPVFLKQFDIDLMTHKGDAFSRLNGCDPINIYRSGEEVCGSVNIHVKRDLPVNHVYLVLQGVGSVSLPLTSSHAAGLNPDGDQADEIYLNEVVELVGSPNGEPVILEAGEHIMPFEAQLTSNLPSSISAAYGKIEYFVKCLISYPEKKRDSPPLMTVKRFLLIRSSSTKDYDEFKKPHTLKVHENIGSHKSTSKATGRSGLKIEINLNRRLFKQGDPIFINAVIKNHSKHILTCLRAAFVMNCLYKTPNREHTETKVICDVTNKEPIKPEEGRIWKDVNLNLPKLLPPTDFEQTHLFVITYNLVFKVEIENGPPLAYSIPLKIGMDHDHNTNLDYALPTTSYDMQIVDYYSKSSD